MEKRKVKVPEEAAFQRLDVFLHSVYPDVSRERVKQAIKAGKVYYFETKGKRFFPITRPSFKVKAGMILGLDINAFTLKETHLEAEDIPLKVIYEDDYLLAIDKPAGIVVHPGAGVASGTIANAILAYLGANTSWIAGKDRPGIVHRLDKDTSGVMLIAKDDRTHARLSRMFEKRKVKKDYLALVWGHPEFDEDVIDVPIERDPFRRDMFRVGYGDSCRQAVTEYKVLRRNEDGTAVVFVHPVTGRTHQIRVHMRYIGHPIVGDRKYGRKPDSHRRMCLHAYRISFRHPINGQEMTIQTDLPEFVKKYSPSL